MATKLRSLATSAITKAILWVVFATFCFFTIMGFVTVYRTADMSSVPIESLNTLKYADSYDFMRYKHDLVTALYWKYEVANLYGTDMAPEVSYRAEYTDGSVRTNVPSWDTEQFKNHKVFGVYRVLPDGNWKEVSASDERNHMTPQSIAYGKVQMFGEEEYGYSGYEDWNNSRRETFTLPLPEDTPDTVKQWIYRNYGSNYDISYSSVTKDFGSVTVESHTNSPTVVEKNEPASELSDEEMEAQYQAWLAENPIPQATVYYAFNDVSIAAQENYWTQCRTYYITQFLCLAGLALAALAAAIWLLAVCGRRPADRELHLWFTERIWSEVTLGAGFFAVLGFFGLFFVGLGALINRQLYNDSTMLNLYCGGITAMAVLILIIAMSLMRLIKARRLIKNSLTFKLCYPCCTFIKRGFDALRSCFDERSFKDTPLTKALQRRQTVFFGVLGAMLVFLMVLALADGSDVAFPMLIMCTIVISGIAYWHVKGNIKTYKEINAGFNDSFEEQMKSERTKTALITNVSHDLKTPLTSIITYVDLLSKEELSDTSRDYVTVLAQKSERLKSIVADLFDLSKSASGNIPLDMETLDLKRLIEQTLADMRDNIDASELILKTKLPENEVNIYSDGKKLYRVFQNIIDNALKYSMSGTRVFITLEAENGTATATVKNTAAYEMDFTAEEVLQRFSRGDKSRSGDGSGLGLSIAESFTRACGGDFKVEIDGDLFKVTIAFKIL